ncbi:putative PLC-like phosphodiesterase, TIM beta/alpha-barrel domain superfamily [Septoria linicola]|nr:putative PLC-like phosphodiesterase, TIM beta/alpha-barrel domain superfamily [Septoria linicola]
MQRNSRASRLDNRTWQGVSERAPNQTLILMVDLKTSGLETLSAVSSQLFNLRSKNYLTHWNGTNLSPRAITVVSTGNTPFNTILSNSTYRDIFIDAPLNQLSGSQCNFSDSFYASVSFQKAVGRVWGRRLSATQLQIIRGQIEEAHKRGLKARYWDTPAWPINLRNYVWDVLVQEAAAITNWNRRVHGLWY